MKVSELSGIALDWAVAKCESDKAYADYCFKVVDQYGQPRYSTDWAQGGQIIERERIAWGDTGKYFVCGKYRGDTPLIAAMRYYVASKLGDEIDIPKELL